MNRMYSPYGYVPCSVVYGKDYPAGWLHHLDGEREKEAAKAEKARAEATKGAKPQKGKKQ